MVLATTEDAGKRAPMAKLNVDKAVRCCRDPLGSPNRENVRGEASPRRLYYGRASTQSLCRMVERFLNQKAYSRGSKPRLVPAIPPLRVYPMDRAGRGIMPISS